MASSGLRRSIVLACCLSCAILSPSAARAGDDDAALQQYKEAQTLYDAGDHAAALPIFEEALKTSGSPNARLYVARCLRELGRLAEAHAAMQWTFREASDLATTDDKYRGTRDAAAAELALLDGRVARVVIAIPEEHKDAVTVTLNGQQLPQDAIGSPVAVDPGDVNVTVTRAGSKGFERSLTVDAGKLETIAVTLPASEPDKPKKIEVVVEEDRGLGVIRAAGIGVLGLGVAGLVVMGVTGAMAQSKKNQLEEDCSGQRCTDPAKADVVDDGKRLKLISNVTLGVGTGLAVAGVLMIIFGGPGEGGDTTAWLAPHPGGAAAGAAWRF